MHIDTKYNVGDVIFVPRCYEVHDQEKITVDDKTWYRNVTTLKAFVKKKRIVKIEASINEKKSILIMYYLIDDGTDDQMAQVYAEDLITSYTEEEALSIAKSYEAKGEPYYGI